MRTQVAFVEKKFPCRPFVGGCHDGFDIWTFQQLVEYDNRPCYLVEGEFVGTGADGEPLIMDVEIIKQIEYKAKRNDDR